MLRSRNAANGASSLSPIAEHIGDLGEAGTHRVGVFCTISARSRAPGLDRSPTLLQVVHPLGVRVAVFDQLARCGPGPRLMVSPLVGQLTYTVAIDGEHLGGQQGGLSLAERGPLGAAVLVVVLGDERLHEITA